jgi:hypothetical protein
MVGSVVGGFVFGLLGLHAYGFVGSSWSPPPAP